MANEKNGLEIERKYIVLMPSESAMRGMPDFDESEIEQIYLPTEPGITRRIRRRAWAEKTRYYFTEKRRVDNMSAEEREWEIGADEYASLSGSMMLGTRPVRKRRCTFMYAGQLFEVDIYPDWHATAIMETELPDRDSTVSMPDFLRIVREVTGLHEYSNAAMSVRFPAEDKI